MSAGPAPAARPVLRPVDDFDVPGLDRRRVQPTHRKVHVLFSDGSWQPCQVLGWARHHGGWAVKLRWPDWSTGWRLYDRANMHPY
jgi:hypothetical protein